MTAYGLVTETMFADAVGSAVAAPSLHNTQPWRFQYHRETDAVQVRIGVSRQINMPNGGPSGSLSDSRCLTDS